MSEEFFFNRSAMSGLSSNALMDTDIILFANVEMCKLSELCKLRVELCKLSWALDMYIAKFRISQELTCIQMFE